ncbi:uncharacterized protein, partial [Clytia hemisphaerica]|uniref:uncharacterized protein n=1 Tax=Clytia hemisphaerica TaxID=252671 RepID=UPI0034D66D63
MDQYFCPSDDYVLLYPDAKKEEGETKSTKISPSQEGKEDNRNLRVEQGENANPRVPDPPPPHTHANTPSPIIIIEDPTPPPTPTNPPINPDPPSDPNAALAQEQQEPPVDLTSNRNPPVVNPAPKRNSPIDPQTNYITDPIVPPSPGNPPSPNIVDPPPAF